MGKADCSRASAQIMVCPRRLANTLCVVASSVIVSALLLTHFNPKRFRIHPIPYLSDAGMRDPERILLSFGLAITGAIFLPIGICQYLHELSRIRSRNLADSAILRLRFRRTGTHRVPVTRIVHMTYWSTFATSFFIALFSAIPGLNFFHHVFAMFFAASGAVWCTSSVMFDHACDQLDIHRLPHHWKRILIKYALAITQILSWLSFGVLWILLKLGWPYRLIPNKDGRFIVLAVLEYVATAALVAFIYMTARDLPTNSFQISVTAAESGHDVL